MFLPEGKGEADKKKKRHRYDVLPLYRKVVISCRPGLFNSMNILSRSDKHPGWGCVYLIGQPVVVIIKLPYACWKTLTNLSACVIFDFQ